MKIAHKLWLYAGFSLALVLSCGEEEDAQQPVAPDGPAALTIDAFIGASGERFSREQAGAITLDCGGLLAVELGLSNWLVRPPANCGATPQCGHVAVIVDDVEVEAATKTVLLELGDAAEGTHHVRAELRLGDHSPFIGDAGTPVSDELDIDVEVLPCPAGAGGGGGQGGQGGQAGAPAAAGSGGDGGDGGAAGNGATAGGAAGDGGQAGATSVGGQGGAGSGGVAGASAGAGGA